MTVERGKTLSHYRLIEKIGEGGMGVVYRAHDERLDRDVAVKVLPAGMLANEGARKRFRKEALALSKLNHPNIETVHDFDTQEGVDFLVMEYIPGVTLNQKLAKEVLSEKEITKLGVQLAEGLAAAHDQGVIHRDLKPGNLRVTPDGRLKILDFGLAKMLRPITDTATTQSLTEKQAMAGTLPYMAPEQLRGEEADLRTDIYSFGVVLYEMATGQRPFREKLATTLAGAILHQAPITPRAVNAKTSPDLERIILKCLDKEPENRYQSAKELGVDLRRLRISGPAPTARRGRIEALAVLPLANLSGDPAQEYFTDGMTDALITDLAKIGSLKVISRTSSMHYKGTDKPLHDIARALNVGAVVEGSVLRAGDRVRITVQLIEAATDTHLWAESYDRDLSDVLTLQGEVAKAIAHEVQVKLTPEDHARLASARPVDPEAHDAYLKGRYNWNRRTKESLKRGIEFFNRSIKKDQGYAMAYAGLADSYIMLERYSVLPPREVMPKAKAAAMKALEIDQTLAAAHASLALIRYSYDWEWPGTEEAFRRSIELNPGYATAHHWFGFFLSQTRRNAEALAEIRKALELDPLSLIIQANLGTILYFIRRNEQAIEQLEKTLELDPNFVVSHQWLGRALELKGLYEDAISHHRTALEVLDNDIESMASLAHAYGLAGRHAEARDLLSEIEQRHQGQYVPPYWLAIIYLGLGLRDETLHHLERAYEDRFDWLTCLGVEPMFDPLRPDPRFQDLIRRMNFPE